MVINPFKAFLFIAGGAGAAVATAYVSGALDPYFQKPEIATLAELPKAVAPGEPASPKAERLPQPAEKGAAAPQSAETPAAAPEPAAPVLIAPSFDIVRAEPDGSIVVAGKAAPGATVEIIAGAQSLGTTKAGPDGDFAIVLDEPLKPGGHELVLRSTTDDKVVATSPETAVVSIPDREDGQVLALVEKPGEPSKLITVPEPVAPKPAQPAEEQAAEQPAMPDQPAAAQGEAAPAGESEMAAATLEQPEPPAPAEPGQAATEGTTPDASPAQPPAAEAETEKPAEPKVAVDAVEIEGRKVFVAGAADPGRRVRVYANDTLLGEAVASPGGRFLIETERDLPVGDYIVRADALEPRGAKVVARAAVPFEREPGEAVAAVAQPSPPTAQADTGAKPAEQSASGVPAPSATLPAPAAVEQPTAEASATPQPTSPEQKTAAADQPAAASSPSEQADPGEPAATAPKLQNVDGSVIIRRGDTLWRISRRVYGRGIRYSTIYLANQDQISDPDRIWPGQVFSVPEKTPEGDAADMTTVKDQAASSPAKAPL